MAKDTTTTKTKLLFHIIYPYKHVAVLIILLSILGAGFDGLSIGILVPLLSHMQQLEGTQELPRVFRWLVALLKPYPVTQQIYLAIGFVILASLLKNLFIAFSIRLGHWLSTSLLADLRLRAVRLLMTVGIAFHHQSRVGDLIDKAIYNTGNTEILIRIGIEFVANALTFIVLFALLFLLSWQLTLVTILLGVAFFGFMRQHMRSLLHMSKTAATTGRGILSATHEALSGIQLIKSYSQEQQQISWLYEKVEANRKVESRRRFKIFSIHPVTDMYATIAIAVLMVIAMQMYKMDMKLMLTQLLPFMYVLLRMVPLLKILNNQRAEITSYWPQVNLVHELLREDNKPFIPDGEKFFSGLQQDIQFRAVTFAYPVHGTPIVKELSFTIPAGETTAIVGESGAGKSTIATLLLRLYDPQQGVILLDGEPLPSFHLASYHRRIGIVSQETFLFNETVKFNIAFSAEGAPSDEQVVAAAQKAGAHEFILELPDGYNTFVGDRGVKLSGGQRQRLAIARAILCDPQILILDEATSALDTHTERRIHEGIVELSQGRTVIIIAHRLSTIKNADQVIVVKHGRVVEAGRVEQLLKRRGEYYQLASSG